MAALGDGSQWGAKITFIPQDAPLGLAHCVLIADDFLGDDDFVMYLGDNLLEQDLGRSSPRSRTPVMADDPPSAQILLKKVPDPHRFGIAELDDSGHVVRLVEKPADPPSDLALVGVYLFDQTIHEAVAFDRAVASRRAGDHRRHPVAHRPGSPGAPQVLTGWWIDTGKLTPLLEANRLLLEKIDPRIDGKVDEASTSRRPGRDRRGGGGHQLDRARAGGHRAGRTWSSTASSARSRRSAPTARSSNTEMEHSVVMERSRIIDIPRLEDSLIGKEAVVTRTQARPRALRLMVGDHCQIDVE